MNQPLIKTKLPGPKASLILEEDRKFISPSYTRVYPFVIERGEGCWVWDVDGNKFLDLNAGIAVNVTGHSHPEIVKVIEEQSKKFIHMSGTDFYYEVQVKLAEKLAEIVPGAQNKRVFFSNSGTEANECAMKLSRYYTKRPYFMAFYGAFHGRTFGSLSLTASKIVQRKKFAPLLPQVIHVPFPDPYRPPLGLNEKNVADGVIEYIKDVFEREVDPEEVAAFFIEPIQGEGGYRVPPKDFYKKLKKLLDEYDILLVDDEVQAGMGRTGRFFAIEHFEVKPDIITVAKGIASGLPLGATISSRKIMSWEPGAHASTFGGNPVSCAVALKTIELLEDGLIENAQKMGDYLINRLKEFQKEFEFIGDVRGIGLMVGVDIVKDRETKEPYKDLRDKIVQKAFHKGILILGAGKSVIRFSPPLIITKEEIDIGLEIFHKVLKEV